MTPIPEAERGDLVAAFHKRLISDDRDERLRAARAWARWEGETISIAGPSALPSRFNEDRFVEAFARIESHYFMNGGFFERDGWLLDQAPTLRHIPCRIVHGRYDMCTPLASAWALKQRLAGSASSTSSTTPATRAWSRASSMRWCARPMRCWTKAQLVS